MQRDLTKRAQVAGSNLDVVFPNQTPGDGSSELFSRLSFRRKEDVTEEERLSQLQDDAWWDGWNQRDFDQECD